MTAKMILLQAWAARRYDPAPPVSTLRQWARDGAFSPPPEKVGREWYVREDARRISTDTPGQTLVERLQQRATA